MDEKGEQMSRLIDADKLGEVKFHPLPYIHITPSDVEAESYKRGWNDAIDSIIDDAPTIEPEPCEDAVSREAVYTVIEEVLYETTKGADNWYGLLNDGVRTLPSVTPKPEQRWIPCSIKQPKKGLMLVAFNDGDIALLKQPTAYRRSDIVAWMPVEPYREEGGE